MIFDAILYLAAIATVLAVYGSSRTGVPGVPVVCASTDPDPVIEITEEISDLPLDNLLDECYAIDVTEITEECDQDHSTPDPVIEITPEETVTVTLDEKADPCYWETFTIRELKSEARGIIPGFSKLVKKDLAHKLSMYYSTSTVI